VKKYKPPANSDHPVFDLMRDIYRFLQIGGIHAQDSQQHIPPGPVRHRVVQYDLRYDRSIEIRNSRD
jgi:hypothetical protein